MMYRKKPVIIEAFKYDGELTIDTLEGIMKADVGDPCKPDIFEKTYELVGNS